VDYDDRGLAAMPKLVGGPKYSRPPGAGAVKTERPADPDDLPLVSAWTDEDHALAKELGIETTAGGFTGPAAFMTASVATAPPDTAGHTAHATGTWSISSGSSSSASSSKRGFGAIFRGRNGRSGAS
jgi:hypothetical protein